MIEKSLKDRLKEAGLYESIESLLGAVEDTQGDLGKADQAERRLIEEVRKIGNEGMHAWANNQMRKQKAEKPVAKRHVKKNSGGERRSGPSPLMSNVSSTRDVY